jgi:hypothetical protein
MGYSTTGINISATGWGYVPQVSSDLLNAFSSKDVSLFLESEIIPLLNFHHHPMKGHCYLCV